MRNQIWLRSIMLFLGSICMGMGVALASVSTYNADAVALLWEGMHQTFQISLGSANMIFSLSFLLIVIMMDRSQIGVGTLISPILQGLALDLCLLFLKDINNELLQWIALLSGIILLAFGTAMYITADIGRGPYIGFVIAMHKRFHCSQTIFRTFLDAICFILALFLGAQLSIGPLISVLLMGCLTEYFRKTIENQVYLSSLIS